MEVPTLRRFRDLLHLCFRYFIWDVKFNFLTSHCLPSSVASAREVTITFIFLIFYLLFTEIILNSSLIFHLKYTQHFNKSKIREICAINFAVPQI